MFCEGLKSWFDVSISCWFIQRGPLSGRSRVGGRHWNSVQLRPAQVPPFTERILEIVGALNISGKRKMDSDKEEGGTNVNYCVKVQIRNPRAS
jgi:hypothetical protein